MINEKELAEISKNYGTPCYVFDLASLRTRVEEMRKIADGKYHLCYSIKANPFLIPLMSELVDHLEVCSPGELSICEHLMFLAKRSYTPVSTRRRSIFKKR
jgi:diaminopimelate decarboxylase